MNEDKLEEFLTAKIAVLKKTDEMADLVMNAKTPADLGDSYRNLIEHINDLWDQSVKKQRELDKAAKNNPKVRKDSRMGWFNLYHSALAKAHSRSRPAVNSRNISKIHGATGAIGIDIRHCLYDLEAKLKSL